MKYPFLLLLTTLIWSASHAGTGTRNGGSVAELIDYITTNSAEFKFSMGVRVSKYRDDFCVSSRSGLEGLRMVNGFTETEDHKIIDMIFPAVVKKYLNEHYYYKTKTPYKPDYLDKQLKKAMQIYPAVPFKHKNLNPSLLSNLTDVWRDLCLNNTWTFKAVKSNQELLDPITGNPLIYLNDPVQKLMQFDPKRLGWLKEAGRIDVSYQQGGEERTVSLSHWQAARALGIHELLSIEGNERDNYELSSYYVKTHKMTCEFTNILVGRSASGQKGLSSNAPYHYINEPVKFDDGQLVTWSDMTPDIYRSFACVQPHIGSYHNMYIDGTYDWKWSFMIHELSVLIGQRYQ